MGGWRIGKILGLEIRIDASWFIIFFLVLWSFTVGVFPYRSPGLSSPTYFAMGAAGTLLFFISVLLHEMAHSVVAIRRGVPVEGITLFIFGGIAHAGAEFKNPRDEFIIAAAGPISSFLIAAVFAGFAAGGEALGWSIAVTGVAGYLAFLNLILALFNLLPGFPLDGGRLLRAAVWHFTGDMTRATRIASSGGRILGIFLMGLGFIQIIGGALIGGLWMVLIGWFVRMAAGSGYSQHLLRTSVEGFLARDAVTGEIQWASPDQTLTEFVSMYRLRGRHRSYPVLEEGRPIGLITFPKIQKVPSAARGTTSVRETMSPLPADSSLPADTPLTEVLDRLQRTGGRPILVLNDGVLLGVVTPRDARRWLERAEM